MKDKLDLAWAKAFYACNIPFNVIEHPMFREAVGQTRPGYDLPTRKAIAGKHLDTTFEEVKKQTRVAVKDKQVTLVQDGWSDIHNQPVIATAIHTGTSSHFISSTTTGANKKTAEYCTTIAKEAIIEAEEKFECEVVAIVTDNEAKMVKMRQLLKESDPDLTTYGCSAHYLNLLGNDITIAAIVGQVVEVNKYFRNHHRPNSLLTATAGSQKPVVPCATRWNSQVDSLKSFVRNRPFMLTICNSDDNEIDDNISKIINNVHLYNQVKSHIDQLEPVAIALDRSQGDSISIADTCQDWLKLLQNEDLKPHKVKVLKRYKQAITPTHLLANLLHPSYFGNLFSETENVKAKELLAEINEDFVPTVLQLSARVEPFPAAMFTPQCLAMSGLTWYSCVKNECRQNALVVRLCELAMKYLKMPASAASIERVFSNFSHIQGKLRNRLGAEKASKLVACYRALRGNIDMDDCDW